MVTRSEPRRRCILIFINDHIRSIGLKSGEFDTQMSLGIPALVLGVLISYGARLLQALLLISRSPTYSSLVAHLFSEIYG